MDLEVKMAWAILALMILEKQVIMAVPTSDKVEMNNMVLAVQGLMVEMGSLQNSKM